MSCSNYANIFDSFKRQLLATKQQLLDAALSVSERNVLLYSFKEFPSLNIDQRPFQDSDNLAKLHKLPFTVKDLFNSLPYPNEQLQVRVLTQDDFGPVWLHLTDPAAVLPLDHQNCCRVQILRLPVKSEPLDSSPPLKHQADAYIPDSRIPPYKAPVETPEQRLRNFQARVEKEQKAKEAKSEAQTVIGAELDAWAYTDDRKLRDVRTLLGTVEKVLWPDAGWTSVALGELMLSDAAVKKAWRKAVIITHPDRHQGELPERQYRADRIFASINEAYKNYSSSSFGVEKRHFGCES